MHSALALVVVGVGVGEVLERVVSFSPGTEERCRGVEPMQHRVVVVATVTVGEDVQHG